MVQEPMLTKEEVDFIVTICACHNSGNVEMVATLLRRHDNAVKRSVLNEVAEDCFSVRDEARQISDDDWYEGKVSGAIECVTKIQNHISQLPEEP